jgi:hypothetical protein
MMVAPTHAVANTGATAIFIMEGTPIHNKRLTKQSIFISLPDRCKVNSSHICNVAIPGLPFFVLNGHIAPNITMASLLGIGILCKAGCKVIFTVETCCVIYNGKVILMGYKEPKSNLWTLPILHEELWTTPPSNTATLQFGLCFGPCPTVPLDSPHIAMFSYHRTTKANAVKFMHQNLCNLLITSLIKAINARFLNGAPPSMPSPSKNTLHRAPQLQKDT